MRHRQIVITLSSLYSALFRYNKVYLWDSLCRQIQYLHALIPEVPTTAGDLLFVCVVAIIDTHW